MVSLGGCSNLTVTALFQQGFVMPNVKSKEAFFGHLMSEFEKRRKDRERKQKERDEHPHPSAPKAPSWNNSKEGTTMQQPLKTRHDYGSLTPQDYTTELAKSAKFERGEDVPLKDLPEELQENVTNPPPSVVKVKEEMEDKGGKKAKHEKGKHVPLEDLPKEVQDANKNPPPSVVKVKEEMENKSAAELLDLGSWENLLSKEGRFERGKSMTVDEVAAVVGPEFKEMHENPPPSVVKLREEMQGKSASKGLTTHLADPKKPGFNLCGENSNPKTTVKSVKDSTCYYCNLAWEKSHGGHMATAKTACGCAATEDTSEEGVLDKTATLKSDWQKALEYDEKMLDTYRDSLKTLESGGKVENLSIEGAKSSIKGLEKVIENKKQLISKLAASGLYGHTKDLEGSCTAAGRKLAAATTKLAKEIYAKDEGTPQFLAEHGKRTGNRAAKLLVGAMKELGPAATLAKTAAGRNGLYGFKERTARLSLAACSDLYHQAGLIAADLHGRKTAAYDQVTGFLKEHSKQGKCAYSALLLEAYPSAPAQEVSAPVQAGKKASREGALVDRFASQPGFNSRNPSVAELLTLGATKESSDFLASQEEEDEEGTKKEASVAAARAKLFVQHLVQLSSGDYEDRLLGPEETIDSLIILLRQVNRMGGEEIGEFISQLNSFMHLRLRPVI